MQVDKPCLNYFSLNTFFITTLIVTLGCFFTRVCVLPFQVPSREVDKDPKKLWTHWNKETKQVSTS